LRVWWRKQAGQDNPEGWIPPPFFILGATADYELLEPVFGYYTDREEIEAPAWPDNVHVHQWCDDLVSRQTLGIRRNRSISSPKGKRDRARWYGRIAKALTGIPHDWPVGIITHQAIEEEAKESIKATGFTDVRSRHYGDERGSNILEGVRVLVLLGLPIPNSDDFMEEAQAFLHDDEPLDFTWENEEQYLEMRDGSRVPVNVGGYWKPPVASYYRQKCQAGLYQALHRIRPYTEQNMTATSSSSPTCPSLALKLTICCGTPKSSESLAGWNRSSPLLMTD
jgi:hypothetical protein